MLFYALALHKTRPDRSGPAAGGRVEEWCRLQNFDWPLRVFWDIGACVRPARWSMLPGRCRRRPTRSEPGRRSTVLARPGEGFLSARSKTACAAAPAVNDTPRLLGRSLTVCDPNRERTWRSLGHFVVHLCWSGPLREPGARSTNPTPLPFFAGLTIIANIQALDHSLGNCRSGLDLCTSLTSIAEARFKVRLHGGKRVRGCMEGGERVATETCTEMCSRLK